MRAAGLRPTRHARVRKAALAPRPAPGGAAIRFGTSGWRGVLGEEVTFGRLRTLVRAVARDVRETERRRRVLVGYDGRFASRAMAQIAAEVLAAEGLRPVLGAGITATPALTHALAQGRHAAGLALTASHNPAADHGLKVFEASGAALGDVRARRIEARAARLHAGVEPTRPRRPPQELDLASAHQAALAALIDRDAIRSARVHLVHDAMHGAAAGQLEHLLAPLGCSVEAIRANVDPHFGGGAPDPVPERLMELSARTRARAGLVLGIANDGDGDRVAAVDGKGRILSETQTIALLVDHLARRGRLGRGVAISTATGSLVEKVAAEHGVAVSRHPIGFKHLARALLEGSADVAGEESGGFALAQMGPDKDGILAGALLVERVASSGLGLDRHVAQLEARFGASACGRIALPRTADVERALARLAALPPQRVDRVRVEAFQPSGGLRFALADGGFLMLRASGTEPVVRVYAEAGTTARLAQRLRAGKRLLAAAAR